MLVLGFRRWRFAPRWFASLARSAHIWPCDRCGQNVFLNILGNETTVDAIPQKLRSSVRSSCWWLGLKLPFGSEACVNLSSKPLKSKDKTILFVKEFPTFPPSIISFLYLTFFTTFWFWWQLRCCLHKCYLSGLVHKKSLPSDTRLIFVSPPPP